MQPRQEPFAREGDLTSLRAALCEPAGARVLSALGDGRALTMSVLAAEAGVAPATASAQARRLLDAGLLEVRRQGRHRFYALASRVSGDLVRSAPQLAGCAPVRSLQVGTPLHAMRYARTCFDHLAGRVGVALFRGLLAQGQLIGGDGEHRHDQARRDRLSPVGRDNDYRLTRAGRQRLAALGVVLAPAEGDVAAAYCVDWSEQRHHLSGAVGRALTARLFSLGWVERLPGTRAVRLSASGERGLRERLAVDVPAP
jgi:DNA-binding transcriptional ArsR family regulator